MTSLNINRSLLQFSHYNLNHYHSAWQHKKVLGLGNYFIHTSTVLFSDGTRSTNVFTFNNFNEYLNRNHSDLNQAVVKYIKDLKPQDLDSQESSSYNESFKWLVDELGKPLDFNQQIDLFKGIKLISRYLEVKYNINQDSVSEVKLSELIGPYFNQQEVRIIDLYNHVSSVYNSDKHNFIGKVTEDVSTLGVVTGTGGNMESNIFSGLNNSSRPLGSYGDITLNDMVVSLKNFNWQFVLNNTEATINTLPLGMNVLSFGLILRTYIKLIHNRPLQPNLSDSARKLALVQKNRNLMLFVILGAPFVIFTLKNTAVKLKDLGSINVSLESSNQSEINNSSSINNSTLFWLITTVYNKIPNCLKFLFSLLFLSVFVLKLLGFNSIFVFLNNSYYLKLYIYISVILAIFFQLFQIFLLHLFSTKKIKISAVLPEFVINWLKEIELVSTNPDYIASFKYICYREIIIYIIILIIFTIFS